jgi:osmotically inducible protein OsmC
VPRIVREANTTWHGNVARGSGTLSAGTSTAFTDLAFTLASRISAPEEKTSPEELLAAAHGGCFTMSLASELSQAGTPPTSLQTRVIVTMDEVEGKGHQIVHSQIEVRGEVPDCDEAAFAQAAEAADAGCPFSALIRGIATVGLTASLDS